MKKELEKVPPFSYYMMDVIPMDIYPRAGVPYDELSDNARKLIDYAVVRYIEWLSKIHHGIVENPIKNE